MAYQRDIGHLQGTQEQILKEVLELKDLVRDQNSRISSLERFRSRVYGSYVVISAAVVGVWQWVSHNGGVG